MRQFIILKLKNLFKVHFFKVKSDFSNLVFLLSDFLEIKDFLNSVFIKSNFLEKTSNFFKLNFLKIILGFSNSILLKSDFLEMKTNFSYSVFWNSKVLTHQ